MYFHNDTDINTNGNSNSNIHIINRTSGKNCSTSSTDSGVSLVDNAATYRAGPTTKDNGYKSEEEETKKKPEAEDKSQRISIEVEATVSLKRANEASSKSTKSKSSPALSIRSTTISIVSIDENAIDSSCIDSDSEAEADGGYTVHKLGQQIEYPPQSPDLTHLNKGLTVISRQVTPSANGPQAPNVVAQQLLNGHLNLATPTSPSAPQQIGSIALSNTTDVTFGDKHFYEGPVTIQQFLIDNREKWKSADGDELAGHDNPGFNQHATSNGNTTDGKLNESSKTPTLCPYLPQSTSRKAIVITAALVLLTVILAAILATTTDLFGKTLHKTNDTKLVVLNLGDYGGRLSRSNLEKLELPVKRVIIAHSVTEGCDTQDVCSYRARVIQAHHMDIQEYDQVGYNFMIGGDGCVYVGRGWDFIGAHTFKYNSNSIGIGFIGNFNKISPTPAQLKACQLLMAEGVRLKKLTEDYKIYGHRQLIATESPGDKLYNIIKTWPHFAKQ
ncbi:peptidoglycan-recognition protein LC isoform X3 [Drosophila busckii]|uniref:peptidoglycan-recognition protein LC isoform X3 n=1 Tax=Drosophila busckii TaxID=30019 RepID=UPI001432CFDF|nr:peptidoglycan-recognition protein LC isoform X3 [Drosophila busckii]